MDVFLEDENAFVATRAVHLSKICFTGLTILGPVHTYPFSNENGAVLLRFQKDLRPHLSFLYRFRAAHYNAEQERSHMVASVRHFGYSWSSGLAPGRVYFDGVTVFR